MALNPFQPYGGSSTLQEEYRGDYRPDFIETDFGRQIVAPDTPYVAAAGRNTLYFIDTRFDIEIARHVKKQLERAFIPKGEEYISIDEISATAEIRNLKTEETIFVFDPVYARVLFAKGINKRNPELGLPEYKIGGEWVVTYDLESISKGSVV